MTVILLSLKQLFLLLKKKINQTYAYVEIVRSLSLAAVYF